MAENRLAPKFERGIQNLCNHYFTRVLLIRSMSNNMVCVVSVLLATLAALAIHFHHEFVLNTGETKNYTVSWPDVLKMFPIDVDRGFKNLVGGGSGGKNDGYPPDYRPGRWQLFPSLEFDPLFWYDLQWNQPDKMLLFPKQWYEDEELAFAWMSIIGNQKKTQIADEVSSVHG